MNVCFTGMIERCYKTLEGVIKKCMERQEDWAVMIDSVLLGMRSGTHSSTGYSPMRMLYNKDPELPFEIADKVKHTIHSDSEGDWDQTVLNSDRATDNLINISTRKLKRNMMPFLKVQKNIVKAQIHQAKGYNNCQASGQ